MILFDADFTITQSFYPMYFHPLIYCYPSLILRSRLWAHYLQFHVQIVLEFQARSKLWDGQGQSAGIHWGCLWLAGLDTRLRLRCRCVSWNTLRRQKYMSSWNNTAETENSVVVMSNVRKKWSVKLQCSTLPRDVPQSTYDAVSLQKTFKNMKWANIRIQLTPDSDRWERN